ncbi:MAG: glycoside hydrolase family 97 protein, partial [Carboxylicivirga sp.]|nr:glycoside hydrolase family 97 protein [Carboxylicivirga sp.]
QWKTVWGQFDTITDHHNQLQLKLKWKHVEGQLLARVYNDGVAFRFIADAQEDSTAINFYCSYPMPKDRGMYFPAGEKEPLGPLNIDELKEHKSLDVPMVVETQQDGFMAVLESDLYSAADHFEVMRLRVDSINKSLYTSRKTVLSKSQMTTPWQVILTGSEPGKLLESTTCLNLATPCQLENTDWIRPGKTLWDWRVHGYTAEDGFKYGINTESYKRFIDFASEQQLEYFLIDDAWYTKVSKGHFTLSPKLNLNAVIDYAQEKKVDLLLYYDRRHGYYGDDELFPYYQSLHMKGIKYGFMQDDVPFTRYAVEESAKSQLLINFHDGPAAMTGLERTLPNAITREYCHAQQDSRKSFRPESFLKMAMINALSGPLDMNNGNFNITGINAGEREKGPRKKNSYLTTVVSEVARTLVIYTGLLCLPDAPEAYAEKADLFEFIKKMPVGHWNESKVLHSKIGEYITSARRANDEWFIGSVASQKGAELEINFDFLEEGQNYSATLYEDTPETNCYNNQEAYSIRTIQVKKGDKLKIVMAEGGGHCMWLKPL